jgi:hypothetical protein
MSTSAQKPAKYLIDTSAFVVFDEMYPPERWGPVWDFLLEQVKTGIIATTDDVIRELKKRFYDLKITEWVALHEHEIKVISKTAHFEFLSKEVYPRCVGVVDTDITSTIYADPMLLAVSGSEGYVLVTDEVRVEQQLQTNPKNLKLPNHCEKLGVPCIYGRYAWTELLNATGLVVKSFSVVPA